MLSFTIYTEFLAEAKMKSKGEEAKRHAKNYVEPYIGQKETHTLSSNHEELKAGSKLTLHGFKVVNGVHYAVATVKGSTKKHEIPFTKIEKPVKAKNKGFDFETGVVKKLNTHGLMTGSGAGFTGGNDFHLLNKKTKKKVRGKMAEEAYQGETKKDLSAAFGQASLKFEKGKGWHFPAKTKERFPKYTAAIERSTVTVDGVTKPLLKHINETYGQLDPNKKSSKNVYSDDTSLDPVHSYLHDHHVDLLHVGSHGTFRAGRSNVKDRTNLGFPKPNGSGRFRVRQKHPTSLTVQFNVKSLDKSTKNIENDDDLEEVKKKLGHK